MQRSRITKVTLVGEVGRKAGRDWNSHIGMERLKAKGSSWWGAGKKYLDLTDTALRALSKFIHVLTSLRACTSTAWVGDGAWRLQDLTF